MACGSSCGTQKWARYPYRNENILVVYLSENVLFAQTKFSEH